MLHSTQRALCSVAADTGTLTSNWHVCALRTALACAGGWQLHANLRCSTTNITQLSSCTLATMPFPARALSVTRPCGGGARACRRVAVTLRHRWHYIESNAYAQRDTKVSCNCSTTGLMMADGSRKSGAARQLLPSWLQLVPSRSNGSFAGNILGFRLVVPVTF